MGSGRRGTLYAVVEEHKERMKKMQEIKREKGKD